MSSDDCWFLFSFGFGRSGINGPFSVPLDLRYIFGRQSEYSRNKLKSVLLQKGRLSLSSPTKLLKGYLRGVFTDDSWSGNLTRILTDTPIGRSPDCAAIGTD